MVEASAAFPLRYPCHVAFIPRVKRATVPSVVRLCVSPRKESPSPRSSSGQDLSLDRKGPHRPLWTAREAEQFFWRRKVRPKETVNDLGQPAVSPRGRDVTFSSVVMVWSYFVAVAICVLLSWCRGNRYHKLGGFKPQKCIVSPFWRLQVKKLGVSRALLLRNPEGIASLPLPSFCWSVGSGWCFLVLLSWGSPVSAFGLTWCPPVSLSSRGQSCWNRGPLHSLIFS